MTRRVANGSIRRKDALYPLLGAGLMILLIAGCTDGKNRRIQEIQGATTIPSTPAGARVAAVLTQPDTCNVQGAGQGPGQTGGQRYGGERDGGGAPFPSAGAPVPGSTTSASLLGPHTSERAELRLVKVTEDPLPFVRPNRTFGTSFQGQFLSAGTRGHVLSTSLVDDGFSNEPNAVSQVKFGAGGSLVYVSQTNRANLLAYPIYAGGAGIGAPWKLATGQRPLEIATGSTPWGDLAVVTTATGFSIIGVDAIDPLTGVGVPGTWREQPWQDRQGRVPTAVAFGPPYRDTGKSEWLFVLSDRAGGHPNVGAGSSLEACHIGYTLDLTESPFHTFHESPYGRGCWPGDPLLIRDILNGEELQESEYTFGPTNNLYRGIGSQQVPGIGTKLAVSGNLAAMLSPTAGPYILATPNTGDIEPYLTFIGHIDRFGTPGSISKDFGIHPYSGNILSLTNNTMVTHTLSDGDLGVFRKDDILTFPNGGKPVALAVDPGPNPKFVLIADEKPAQTTGNFQLWVGDLDSRSVRFNRNLDRIELGCNRPLDVDIRRRALPINPPKPEQVAADTTPSSGS